MTRRPTTTVPTPDPADEGDGLATARPVFGSPGLADQAYRELSDPTTAAEAIYEQADEKCGFHRLVTEGRLTETEREGLKFARFGYNDHDPLFAAVERILAAHTAAAIRAAKAEALRDAADDWHDLEQALEAVEEIILDAEDQPFRFTPSERRRMAICDVLTDRADTIATTEGDTERGRVVQSGEHRGRQKSPIASEPPVSEVAGSSPAPAHPAPASPVVSAEAVEALAAEWESASVAVPGNPAATEHLRIVYAEHAAELRALLADPADSAGGGAG